MLPFDVFTKSTKRLHLSQNQLNLKPNLETIKKTETSSPKPEIFERNSGDEPEVEKGDELPMKNYLHGSEKMKSKDLTFKIRKQVCSGGRYVLLAFK